MSEPHNPERAPGSRFTFGARPTVGTAAALKAVAQDTSALVSAEIALAKAELMQGVKANGLGAGLLVGAAVMVGVAMLALLVAAGFALALVVPGWAAALIIAVVLLVVGGILAKLGLNRLGTPVSVERAKTNVQEDVAWFKTHLGQR